MRIIGWLLTKMLLMRFAIILFGIGAFVLTLDIITYSDDILKLHDGDLSAIGRYAGLRAAGILSQFVVISVLLATLLMLTEISRHSELVAIWSAGISQFRVMALLMPAAAMLGIANFLVVDRAVPSAAAVLNEWGIGDFSEKKLNIGRDDPLWMRAGNDVLRAEHADESATHLRDVIVFRRDAEGLLSEQLHAAEAKLVNGRWALSDVAIYYRANETPTRVAGLIYSGPMRPAATGTRSGEPDEMSLRTLSYFIDNSGFGIRPAQVYETWRHKRFTVLFTSALMILIAVPLAGRFRRGGGLGLMFAAGVGLGFGFFLFEGISLTMGELGLIPPFFAAWAPIMIFATAAGAIAFRQERP